LGTPYGAFSEKLMIEIWTTYTNHYTVRHIIITF
jgi:hypothetical protein